jgi:hypothetical protein
MAGVLFVHWNTAPTGVPVKFTGAVGAFWQTTWFGIAFTAGVGLTVIVKAMVGPVQTVVTL